jgi:uncharacterized protein YbjT (DUF2867 family)
MNDKKIITVFGATGAQGNGLAKAILSDRNSEFSVRAVTRDPQSDKARELAVLGAEIVRADIDEPETIGKALEGAYGAFFVTFFWAHYSPEKENEEARHFAEAARKAGLKHIIWSTLEDTRKWVPLDDDRMPTLNGKYKVPHFDGKGAADHYFSDAGLPVTYLLTSFYWDNFIHFGMGPQHGNDGKYHIAFPMDNAKLPGISADDIGKCAYGIFKKGTSLVGKTVGIAGEHLQGAEMAAKMSKALGVEVVFDPISPESYRGLGFPGADDLGNMFQFKRDFESDFRKPRNIEYAKELNPQLKSFDEWLAANGSAIPLN